MSAPHTNSAHDKTTVFDREGSAFEVTQLNALDLTRSGKFFWNPPSETVEEDAPVEPIQTTVAPVEEPAKEAAPVEEEAPAVEEPVEEKTYVEDEAKVIAGDDVSPQDYLKGFSVEALRSKLEKDFGFKARRNATKDTLIEKYIELDAEQE